MKKILLVLFALSIFRTECSAQTVSGQVSGYDYVDLGVPSGTKWATYNVGATKPEEYGDYFAWEETKPKKEYTWKNYKWSKGGNNRITKYCENDKKEILEAKDDAATKNWGKAWRIPTNTEYTELYWHCEWKFVKNYNDSGVNGQLGISKENGATILIPAAGQWGETLSNLGSDFFYWLNKSSNWSPENAYCLDFPDSWVDWNHYRYYGRTVRAALK
ncbi:MAG: hypothetical protein MJZ19_09780 [Paludibacteraceae bacterium]|nr:hypothetical protein [Paludibacteraceae bacterium]